MNDVPVLLIWLEFINEKRLDKIDGVPLEIVTCKLYIPSSAGNVGIASNPLTALVTVDTVATLFVAQMQDYLGLGKYNRINVPGTDSGNWQWRLIDGEITEDLAEKIYKMSVMYDRTKKKETPKKPAKTKAKK